MSVDWLDSQNSEEAQLAMAASDTLWGRVQRIRAAQVLLVVVIPVTASAAALSHPTSEAQLGAAYVGFLMIVTDVLLNWFASRKKRDAAHMQDRFDSVALYLPRADVQTGDDLDISLMTALARRQQKSRAYRNRDWYTPLLGELPLEFGRIACMRESTSWDSSLRRSWATALFILLALAIMSIVSWWILTEQRGDIVFLSVVAPLAPAIIWTLREALEQYDAASAYDRLRAKLRAVWDSAIAGKAELSAITDAASNMRTMFLAYRAAASPAPNWLYAFQRGTSATNAEETARAFVREFRSHHRPSDSARPS